MVDLSTKVINADTIVFAQWIRQYTVDFQLNGGEGVRPSAQLIDTGKTAISPADPTFPHKDLEGWYINLSDATAFDFNTPIGENLTLVAKWVSKPLVMFSIDGNTYTASFPNQYVGKGGYAKDPTWGDGAKPEPTKPKVLINIRN